MDDETATFLGAEESAKVIALGCGHRVGQLTAQLRSEWSTSHRCDCTVNCEKEIATQADWAQTSLQDGQT